MHEATQFNGVQGSGGIDLSTLSPGFADIVHDAQSVFRALLEGLSRPGRIVELDATPAAVAGDDPVPAAAFAALLALADYSTPVMLQRPNRALSDALRFHTGAPLTTDPAQAVFAYMHDAHAILPLESFSLGEPETPEQAVTLFVRVESLDGGRPLVWRGPGIRDTQAVCIEGLPESFWSERAALAAQFPCGIDCYLLAGSSLIGLPRTTLVEVG
jgi:alpha-D-ribose 1-methylphosphonate 5-triphosphate synthase subunit PhnH